MFYRPKRSKYEKYISLVINRGYRQKKAQNHHPLKLLPFPASLSLLVSIGCGHLASKTFFFFFFYFSPSCRCSIATATFLCSFLEWLTPWLSFVALYPQPLFYWNFLSANIQQAVKTLQRFGYCLSFQKSSL